MRLYLSLYLLISGAYLLTASGRIGLSDSVAMYNVAQSVATEGSLSSEPCNPNLPGQPNHCVLGKNGRYYAGFGLFPSFVAAPAILTGKWISRPLHLNPLLVTRACVSLLTALVAALVPVVLAMWAIRLGYTRATAVIAACILAFASSLWHYGTKGFYSEPYFTLGLMLAAYLLSCPEIPLSAALAGLAFGAACGSRLNGVILFPVFILALALRNPEGDRPRPIFLREAALFTGALSICGVLIAWSNYDRFGGILKTGYHLAYPTMSALFSTPAYRGMRGLLFNQNVGLFVFAPWSILAFLCFRSFLREHRPEAVLCGGMFLVNFAFFVKYDSWHGGWVAGPRFLLPTLPFLLMAMVPSMEKLRSADTLGKMPWGMRRPVLASLVMIAFLIQLAGTFYPEDRFYSLWKFYCSRPPKPWSGRAIPLASLDFLFHMTEPEPKSAQKTMPLVSEQPFQAQQEERLLAGTPAGATAEQFLRAHPNSENMTLPNLFVVKVRWLGYSAAVVYAYVLATLAAIAAGLVGVRKYAGNDFR